MLIAARNAMMVDSGGPTARDYVQKRDAAALPTTKALYQAFIDAIDRIKARMDGED